MLFGIGEGLGYIFWNMKMMTFPFIGGRVKPDMLTERICRNLNLKLEVQETSSVQRAWQNVKSHIDNGKAVGLKLDSYHLAYFTSKIHFAGHYVSIYGYDEKLAYLNDTNQQGRDARTSLESLALARNEKGPMSSRNRSYTISQDKELPELKTVIPKAIFSNANDFLDPAIKNMGYKGIRKTSDEIKKWFKSSKNIKKEFQTSASLMERAGTGGALFRNMYRDFLKESAEIMGVSALYVASEEYTEIAELWEQVAHLFDKTGETEDISYVEQASELLIELSMKEQASMTKLKDAFSS